MADLIRFDCGLQMSIPISTCVRIVRPRQPSLARARSRLMGRRRLWIVRSGRVGPTFLEFDTRGGRNALLSLFLSLLLSSFLFVTAWLAGTSQDIVQGSERVGWSIVADASVVLETAAPSGWGILNLFFFHCGAVIPPFFFLTAGYDWKGLIPRTHRNRSRLI